MRFAYPAAFWLLLLLPVLVLFYYRGKRQHSAFLRRFGDPTLLRRTSGRFPVLHQEWAVIALLLLPCLSISLALTDPHLPYGTPQLRTGALDVVMVLDISKSMAAEDYGSRSRLGQAREIARGLLPILQGNRIGLVTFAGTSFRQAELTDDITALDFILTYWVDVDTMSVGGSDIAGALAMGLSLFPERTDPGSESRTGREQIMLLFSDGGDNNDALHAVLSQAVRQGVRIVTLGLGHLEPSRIPLYDSHRKFSGYMQVNNRMITTQLNEAPLQQIAATTGGTYLRIRRSDEWHNLLTQKTVAGKALERQEIRLFQPLLGFGLLTFGMHQLRLRL
jgi:Ca-activated chloride channel family protein